MGDSQNVGDAEYVFAVRLRLSPSDPTVRLDPATVETTLFKRAAPPGEDGWLFFRDHLWRGEVNDHGHMCELAEEMLGTDVESVEFRELRTDDAYYEALQDAIAANLELFNADDVPEVLTKYLGSRIHVRDRE
ncbi:LWR-salt protein [Natronomonas sp. CBA1123]|uniref:LWR-salt protein n=1 Tax=Natronomonas sp. CBA1123 TaxID=2668070 RepID=UPI0012E9FC83|nr:LWR-salt protein [Natronomonas sp. CBA1123]MUV85961.1 LWR-salt protein [Natronomonas sp. CBA1123]